MAADGLITGTDGKRRCSWCGGQPDYVAYHDEEWGFPVDDDRALFEKICLEGFQSGLSWLTILRKRESFREAFAGFEVARVARLGTRDVTRLLKDASIVRHRGKIVSAIQNARRAADLIDERGSLAAYFWRFEPDPRAHEARKATAPVQPYVPPEARALSSDLKKRGFTFVGPTTLYAFMQAMGLVNDHEGACFVRARVARARRGFRRGSMFPGGSS